MKHRLTFLLSAVALLWFAQVHSQNARQSFGQLKQDPANAAGKVAEHHDHPSICLDFDWNSLNSAWDSVGRLTFTYTPQGEWSQVLQEGYQVGGFMPYQQITLTYTPGNLVDRELYQIWNGTAWENYERADYSYDGNENLLAETFYGWRASQWDTTVAYRYTNSYVFTNKLASRQTEYYDTTLNQWDPEAKLEAYHWPNATAWDTSTTSIGAVGNWMPGSRSIVSTWHNFAMELPSFSTQQTYTQGAWVNLRRYRSTFGQYDSEDQVTDAWNGSSWDSIYKFVRTLDAFEHERAFDGYTWNGSWLLSYRSRFDYLYDTQNRTLERIFLTWDGIVFQNDSKQVYSSFVTVGAPSPSLAVQMTAYPNPCTNRLNFDFDSRPTGPVQIALYDLQGRLRVHTVSPAKSVGEISMPISETLENGTYIYRVQTKAGTATGKVVVLR